MADWLAEWLPRIRTRRALEIGAGAGVFTRRLLPWRGSLLATDISPAVCAEGCATLPQVGWQIMSAEKPLAGPWDWMFCSSVLHWVSAPERIFSAWRRSLAKNGRILAGLFVADSLPELKAFAVGEGTVVWRTAGTWRKALEESGLSLVREEVQTRIFYYPTASEFLRSLPALAPSLEPRFSPALLRQFLGRYEELYRESQGVRATWNFYRFEAQRAEDSLAV
jgi:SAM-dependent methyltransferase